MLRKITLAVALFAAMPAVAQADVRSILQEGERARQEQYQEVGRRLRAEETVRMDRERLDMERNRSQQFFSPYSLSLIHI